MSLRRIKKDLCKGYNRSTKEVTLIKDDKGKVVDSITTSILKKLKLRSVRND